MMSCSPPERCTSAATPATGELVLMDSTGANPTQGNRVALAFVMAANATFAEALAARSALMAVVAAAGAVSGVPTFMAEGDSLTDLSTPTPGAQSWTQELKGLSGMPAGRYINAALSGQQAFEVDAQYDTQSKDYRPDGAYSNSGWFLPFIGTNDLAAGLGVSASTLLSRLQAVWDKGRADWPNVGRFTLLPRADVGWGAGMEAERVAANALVRANTTSGTTLFDLAAIPALQDPTNTTYFNADKLHLTGNGYATVALVVRAVILGTVPQVTVQPQPQTVNAGATATFTATATGSWNSLRWLRKPGGTGTAVPVVGGSTSSSPIAYTTGTTTASGGNHNSGDTYAVELTWDGGVVTSSFAPLTVLGAASMGGSIAGDEGGLSGGFSTVQGWETALPMYTLLAPGDHAFVFADLRPAPPSLYADEAAYYVDEAGQVVFVLDPSEHSWVEFGKMPVYVAGDFNGW